MGEKLRGGVTKDELADIFKEAAGLKQASDEDIVINIKSQGAKEVSQELKQLSTTLRDFHKLNQSQRGALNLLGSESKVINRLKQSWNEYATAKKNGLIDDSGNITVSKNDSRYNQINAHRSNLFRSALAAEYTLGADRVSNIIPDLKGVISALKETESFKNYSLNVDSFVAVEDHLKRIKAAAEAAGMSIEEAFEGARKSGIFNNRELTGFSYDWKGEDIKEILSLADQESAAASALRNSQDQLGDAIRAGSSGVEQAFNEEASSIGEGGEKVAQAVGNAKKYIIKSFNDLRAELEKSYEKQSVSFSDFYDLANEEDQTPSNIADKIESIRQRRDNALSSIYRANNNLANGKDSYVNYKGGIVYYEEELEKYIGKYHEYTSQIEFLQEQLVEKSMNFKPGENWDTDSIQTLITLLQNLVKEIQAVSKAFGDIDDDSGIKNLLNQLNDIDSIISSAFKTDNVNSFNTAVKNLDSSLTNIIETLGEIQKKDITYNLNVTKGQTEGTTETGRIADQEWTREYQKMLNAYNKIFSLAKKHDLSNEQAILSLFNSEDVTSQLMGTDPVSKFSLAGIQSFEDVKQRVDAITQFFNYINNAAKEIASSQAWNKAHGYDVEDNNATRFLREAARYISKNETATTSFRTSEERVNRKINKRTGGEIDLGDTIEEISQEEEKASELETIMQKLQTSFTGLQNVFKKGLGLSEEGDKTTSYLKDVSDAIQTVTSELSQVDDKGVSNITKVVTIFQQLSETLSKIKTILATIDFSKLNQPDESTKPATKQNIKTKTRERADGTIITDTTVEDAQQQKEEQAPQKAKVVMDPSSTIVDDVRDALSAAEPFKIKVQVADAERQIGEQIANGAEKAKTALVELFQNFTFKNINGLNIGELLGYDNVKDADIYKDLSPINDVIRKITRGDVAKGDNKITIPTSNVDGEAITEEQIQKIEKYKTILHALGYELGDLNNNHKTSILSGEIIPTESAVKNINEMIDALIKLNVIKGVKTEDSAKHSYSSLEGEAQVFERIAKAAQEAAEAKSKFSSANETAAKLAKDTTGAAKEEANALGNVGKAAESSTGKEKEAYDDTEMKRRAKLIDDEQAKYSEGLKPGETIKSIQRMYDSHDNLVQSVITTVKTIESEDGRILEQLEHYQIKWDGKDNALYGSRMTADDYQKYFGASDKDALEEALKQSREYEEREKAYLKERARLIAEGKRQEKEQSSKDSNWQKMERQKELSEQEELNRMEEARLKTMERRKAEEQKAINEQNKYINKAQEDAWKEQEKEKQKQEEADNRRATRQAYDDADKRLQEEREYQKERARQIEIGKRQEEEIIKQHKKQEEEYAKLFGTQDAQDRQKNQRNAESERRRSYLSELNEYNKAMDDYERLFQKKSSNKTLNASEEMQMNQALNTIVATEERWNAAKGEGIELSNRQRVAVEQIQKAKAGGATTKEMLEQNALQKEAIKIYDSVQSKITKMQDQQEWRPEGWMSSVQQFQDQLNDIKISDIIDKDSFNDRINDLNKLKAQIQDTQKSTGWQPVAEDWQANADNSVAKWMNQNKIAAKEYREELENLRKEAKQVGSKQMAEQWNADFAKIQADAADKGLLGKSLGDRFKDQFKNTMTSLATYYLSFQDFIRYGREAITMIKDMDTAMTNLQKVADGSASAFKKFQEQSFDIAKETGSTATSVVDAATEWARLGYNLNDSAKLSRASVIYSNVGEIDAQTATTDLVSVLKAFKMQSDDAMQAVDVLNEIGNNYAVSSAQLGEILEKSSASLALSGDSMEQVVAMGAAMNAVVQDASVVGSTLKVVGLRLRGAKTELTSMDEDTDGMVSSTPKLRSKILALTNVTGKGGFDIMKNEKEFKSMYEIMDGIAERWNDMAQIDQAALLELISGKNRAQGTAALLSNWGEAEKALADAYDAQGSALRENEKYMNSLEGHIAKFQNELQRLTSDAIDSGFIKGIIDFGTQAIKVIDGLADAFGSLNLVIGTVAGVFATKKGLDVRDFGKGFINLFSRSGKDAGKAVGSQVSESLLASLKSSIPTYGSLTVSEFLGNGNLYGLTTEMQDFLAAEEAAGRGGDQLTAVLARMQGTASATGEAVEAAGSRFSGIAKIGKTALSALGNIALSVGVSMAIEGIITLLVNWARASEIAIEKGKQSRSLIEDTLKDYKSQSSSLKELGEQYGKLVGGVEITSTGTKNKTLSSSEYQEFLDISNQIAELSPELVSSYDSQGNAILNLGTDVDSTKDKLQQFLNLQRDVANLTISDNLEAAFKGVAKEVDKLEGEREQLLTIKEEQSATQEAISNIMSFNPVTGKNEVTDAITTDTFSFDIAKDQIDQYQDKLDELGISYARIESMNPTTETIIIQDFNNVTDEQLKGLNTLQDAQTNVAKATLNATNAQIRQNELLQKAKWNEIVPSIQSYVETTSMFDELPERQANALRDGLKSVFQNMDYGSLQSDIEAAGGLDDWLPLIISGAASGDKVTDAFIGLFDLQKQGGTKTYTQIAEARDKYFQTIKNELGDDYNEDYLGLLFGYSDKDSEGKIKNKRDEQIAQIAEKFNISADEVKSIVNDTINADTSDQLLSSLGDIGQKETAQISGNLEKFKNKVNDILSTKTEDIKTDLLSDLFADETYQTNASNYEKQLSSVTSAMEKLRENGKLTSSEMADLQEVFPKLTDFTSEGVSDAGFEVLANWIEVIRDNMSSLSPEGVQQANIYIQHLVESMGELADSSKDAKDLFMQLYAPEVTDYASVQEARVKSQTYDRNIKQLQEQLGDEEIDWNVVATLVASDQFTGTAEEILAKYKNEKLVWDIILNGAELEKDIKNREARIARYESDRALKESRGETLSSSDYNDTLREQKGIWEDRRIQAENDRDLWKQHINKEDEDFFYQQYQNSVAQANQAESNYWATKKEQLDASTNAMQTIIDRRNSKIESLNREIDQQIQENGFADVSLYEQSAKDYKLLAKQQNIIGDFFTRIAKENPEFYDVYTNLAQDAYDAAMQAAKSGQEAAVNAIRSDLDYDITNREHKISKYQSDNATKEALGDVLSPEDFNSILAERTAIYNDYVQEAARASAKYDADPTNGALRQAYIDIQNKLSQAETDMWNAKKEQLESYFNEFEKAISDNDSKIAAKQAENAVKEARGEVLGSEDYADILAAKQSSRQIRAQELATAQTELGRLKLASNKNDVFGKIAKLSMSFFEDQVAERQQQFLEAEADVIQTNREKEEAAYNGLKQQLEQQVAESNRLQGIIDSAKAEGSVASKEVYDALTMSRGLEKGVNEALAKGYTALYGLFGNAEYKEQATSYSTAATTASTQQASTRTGYSIDSLQKQYSDIESSVQTVNELITVKQARGLKANVKDYKTLANLTKQQIANLKKQNAELKAGGDLAGEQLDLYRQNESSINNLYSALADYEKTAKNLVVSDAQNLAQAISSAMSEMTTQTGLSTDTMQQIVTGFSELGDAADISSIFYGTADGVKVDMIALKRLAEQQSKIVNQRFAERMDEITEAMNRATASGDMTGLRNAQNELADLQRQQAQYLATYQEQMEAFTRLSAISFADQTKNEGADYETAQGYMKTGKELFDKGLIGTDDFKARAAYLDPYGRTDWETFEQNYKRAERYFTDDASGVQHFLDDLRAKGLSTYDDLTGWSLNFADTAKAALQMGMSDEFFMDVLTRTKDYGFNLQYVNSMEEAELKANDLKQQLVDAQIEYAELVNMGASEEVLAEKSKQIEQITSDMGLLKEATNNYVEGSQRSFIEGFKNIEGTIDALEGAYKIAMENHDVSGMELIEKEVQRYADQYGLEIEIDAKTGEITIDEASYNAAAEKYGKSFGEAFREHAQKEINKGLEEAEQSGKSGTIISNLAEEGEEYMSIVDKILPGLDQADSTVNSILSQLRNTDAESLSEIVFGDDELAEGQAGAIESAIDGLISELGLAQDDGKTLLKVLMDILGYDYEIDMKTNMAEANAELEAGLHRIKELQAHNVIQLSFDVEQNPTEVTNMAELQNRQQEIRTAKTKVSVDTSEYKALDALDKQYGRQIRIQAVLDDTQAKTTIADLKQMTEEELAKKFELDLSTEEGRAEVEALKQQIGLMDEGELAINVKIDDTQFTELIETISHTKPDVEVGADTKKGKASVAGFVKDTEKQHPTIQVGSNTTSATNNAQSAVSAIAGMKASINVGVSGLEAVKSNVLSTINSLRNQAPIIIKTVVQRISSGGDPGKAIGTFHAKASGTAYNVLNYKPIKAHAKGTSVSLDNDEYALTNEVGQESIVRNGHWYMLPGGPHFEHLKKGDIVFNAQQTQDLIDKGRTPNYARSLATGTIYNGINAYAGTAGNNNFFKPGTPGANTSTNANTTATNNNTKATNANTKATEEAKTGLDKFKEWGEKWKDWVEVRLERLQQIVDRTTAKSENEIATTKQNKLLQQAMEVIGNPTNPSKSKRDTLIGDNLAGAARYQKHADLVRQEAINDGLVTAAQADDIIAKIKSGVIDLEQYEEGPREFISSYTEWYDKIVQCTDAIEDLKSQLKDLEQQKLDNITDIYDALIGRNKAIQDSSVAMANFYTAMGKTVNSKYFKDELNNQISMQKSMTGHYKKEIARYEEELKYAEKVFGKNSRQYIEAATTLQEMRTSLTESRTATKDLQKALQDLDITKIEYLLDRITNFTSKLGAILSRVQTKGQSYGQSDTDYYTRQSSLMYRQINYNNSAIEAYGDEIDKRIQQIQENGWQVDSEQYKEAVDWIQKAEIECENLAQTNEELKQNIRDLRWEPFKELQRTVKNVTGDMEHLADLIGDAEVFDIGDGTIITDRGLTKLALFATQMQKNNEYIANERAALKKLQEEYENNIISKQKYNEESEEMIKSIQDTVRANNTLEKSITDVYKTQIQNENKALTELIGLRKDALSQKKAYYDYNRTLKDKNKEIAQLRAEAAALEGVGNQASIARLAQIRSDLAEKETDLADTRYDHSIEMQQQGYDRLNQYANTTLDKTLRAVEGSYYAQQLVIANMLEQVKGNYETVTGQINTIIDTTGTVVHDTTQDVVNEMPQQLDPLMTKFENYKTTLLNYIAQIIGTDENGGIKGLGESITGLAGEGGALATFKNAAQSDFGAATGYVNMTDGAVKTLGQSLFSFTGGDGIFAVFKEAAITHLTGSGGVTEALSQVGTGLDEMLGNLNSALSFNDTANITDSAQVTIGGIITDRIETLTTRSNEILNNIEKDVYDKIAGITEGIEPSEELNKGNKDYNYIEDVKKDEPKAEPKAEPKSEPKTEPKTETKTPATTTKKTITTKNTTTKKTTTTKKAEAKPAATPKATTIPLTAEMRDAVAAATWNGTLGWELNNPDQRLKKYEELFGPNNGIQDVVNKGYKYANDVAARLGNKLSDYSYDNLKKKLQAGGFKKGTLGVPADDTYWTHANEMIIRRSDGAVLTPLSKGSPVFPANLAENLWKWGAINPAEMMTKLSAGVPQSAVNNNITYNNHYDSLLTVNGDVEKEALPELKEILKQACEYTNKFNARESRKLGRK